MSVGTTITKSEALGAQYGIRDLVDIEVISLGDTVIGGKNYLKNTVIYVIDTAKTSSLETGSSTVYAQGGSGNPRLMAWEGDKTVTFTFEDALISPATFYMLSGGVADTADQFTTLTVNSDSFGKAFKFRAKTFIRSRETQQDHCAILTIHKGKIQSNFTIAMSPSGDPSTFTFTVDCFPQGGDVRPKEMFKLEFANSSSVDFGSFPSTIEAVALAKEATRAVAETKLR